MYTEITIEEADRIIKSANLVTLAKMVCSAGEQRYHMDHTFGMYEFAKSILSN